MNLYIVKLKNRRLNQQEIVQADSFYRDFMSGMIVFKDEDGKNVAMYQDYMVESVRKKIEIDCLDVCLKKWQ